MSVMNSAWQTFSLTINVKVTRGVSMKNWSYSNFKIIVFLMQQNDCSSNGAGQIILSNKVSGLIPGPSSPHTEVSFRQWMLNCSQLLFVLWSKTSARQIQYNGKNTNGWWIWGNCLLLCLFDQKKQSPTLVIALLCFSISNWFTYYIALDFLA